METHPTEDMQADFKDDETNKEKNSKESGKKVVKFRNACNIFFSEIRTSLVEEFPDLSFKDIAKMASEKFKQLPPEEMEKYTKLSQETKELFNKAKLSDPNSIKTKGTKEPKDTQTPYYYFMTKRHEELRASNPELKYQERSQMIMKEWKEMTIIQKAEYDKAHPFVPDEHPEDETNGEQNPEDEHDLTEEQNLLSEDESEDQHTKQQKEEEQKPTTDNKEDNNEENKENSNEILPHAE